MSRFDPLQPHTWPVNIHDLPPEGYLVGGAVRDKLLQRDKNHWDLDIVLPLDVIPLAKKLARKYHAHCVVLDAERQIVRLIFPQITLDLSQQQGDDIYADLSQRDFTINALAWHYHTGELLDPYKGQQDLAIRMIRMVHPDNLRCDPLRLFRAYRLAAQLEFSIEPNTRHVIKSYAPLLGNVAPERIQNELHLLFATKQGADYLLQAWADGILAPWFPVIETHWMTLLPRWDGLLLSYPELAVYLHQELRPDRSVLNTLKLRCLLPEDAAHAQHILSQLRYSRAEMQYVSKLIELWPVLHCLMNQSLPSIAAQFDLFQRAGSVLPGLLAVALVHGYPWSVVGSWLQRFADPHDPVAHALPLVSGHDLMRTLHLHPSPQVGQLLCQLALAHAQGQISTPDDALALARVLVQKGAA